MSTPTEPTGTFNASASPLTALPTSRTSSLERYLAQIPDPALRESISREIAGMGRNFGLVFERHHPEGIKLPKHRVKRGSKVVINTVKDSGYFRVARLDKAEGTAGLVDDDGNEATYPLEALTVAKEFGDVMYPGLKKLSEVRRGAPDAPVHTIINGENYHALEALQYTHAGKVDLIYIDPPYNTGANDWKYNDRYIDSKDGYRHSKWLSFMEKRLLLAKQLLTPSGIVMVAIGDDEHHRLRMLLDQVFGAENFISDVVWNGGKKNDSKYFSNGTDYTLVYSRSKDELGTLGARWRVPKSGIEEIQEAGMRCWLESGSDASVATDLLRKWWASLPKDHVSKVGGRSTTNFKFVDGTARPGEVFADSSLAWPTPGEGPRFDIFHPVTGLPVRVPKSGWGWTRSSILEAQAQGLIYFGKDETSLPYYKRFITDSVDEVAINFVDQNRRSAGEYLGKLLGEPRFPFPKDHNILMRWFRMIAPKDAVILDFFGGSGSTAEAVIRLNAEDGGTRQAILVTNNELAKKDDAALRKAGHVPGDDAYEALGVFHHVTKPRLETVVTGVRQDGSKYSDGLDANVAFFELTYLDEPEIVTGRALNDLAGLFWLKSGGVGGTIELDAGARAEGFAISESGSTAMLFSPGRASILAEKLAANDQPISHLFIVTDSEAQGDEAASHFAGGINVERIYGSYLEAFQVNRKD